MKRLSFQIFDSEEEPGSPRHLPQRALKAFGFGQAVLGTCSVVPRRTYLPLFPAPFDALRPVGAAGRR